MRDGGGDGKRCRQTRLNYTARTQHTTRAQNTFSSFLTGKIMTIIKTKVAHPNADYKIVTYNNVQKRYIAFWAVSQHFFNFVYFLWDFFHV